MGLSGRRVAVFGLGGTIAMTATPDGGVAPALSASDLVAAVPALSDVALDVVDFRRVPGASLSFDDLCALSAAIDASGADGVVVTQGTDTIEETAYLLDLWHTGSAPVVVTGAMRNPTQAGHDGPANLLAAVRLAGAASAEGKGVLVVLADEIHAADRVRKTHSTGVDAFTSPNGGPLGLVVGGTPVWYADRRPRLHVRRGASIPSVGLVTVTLGDDGALLRAAWDLDGLVVAGMGVGHAPSPLVHTLQALAARMPVVLASRTGAGPVLTDTYAFPGSERDLIARGLVPAGVLDPLRARLLLYALLADGADRARIASTFTGNVVRSL